MAGSRRWFEYIDDFGIPYMVELDETLGENANMGFNPISAAARAGRRILRVSSDRSLKARYLLAYYVDTDGRPVYRKFYVGRQDAPVWGASETVDIGGQTYNITTKAGEVRYFVPPEDTGLIDGDVDSNDIVVP